MPKGVRGSGPKRVVSVDEALQSKDLKPISENPSVVKPGEAKDHVSKGESHAADPFANQEEPEHVKVVRKKIDEPLPVDLEASGPVDERPTDAVPVRADHANDPENPPEPVHSTEQPEAKGKTVKFIKNHNPREKIILNKKTGESVTFPEGSCLWLVKDKALADKIRDVAKTYKIIEETE